MPREIIDLSDTIKILAEEVSYDAFGDPATIVGTIIAWELAKGVYKWVIKKEKVTVVKEDDRWQIKEPEIEEEWVSTRKYINALAYKLGITMKPKVPTRRYINVDTLICNNDKVEPSGDYQACCYYYLIYYDGVVNIHKFSVQYRSYDVDYDEIKSWATSEGVELLERRTRWGKYELGDIVAYEFLTEREHYAILTEYRTGTRFIRGSLI